MKPSCILSLVFTAGVAACGRGDGPPSNAQYAAQVARTSYGVAHVRADNFRGLGYGLAYAYAQDNVCMFADTLLSVRGERSRFFGPDALPTQPRNGEYSAETRPVELKNEDSDFFFKGYVDIDLLKAGYAKGSQEARDMLSGYAAGYNRYLKDYAGKYPAACNNAPWVRPITVEDVYLVVAQKAMYASGEVFAQDILNAARDAGAPVPVGVRTSAPMLAALDRIGSNALAIGGELSQNGRGMLLGNPHFPWHSTDRFYQVHLSVPGRYDAMGAMLGGIPIVVIGFNSNVAWTHTRAISVHLTTFRLALDPADTSGTTYLSDGVPLKMGSRTVTVDSLLPDGSIRQRSKTFYFSKHGALLVRPQDGLVWNATTAFAIGDANRTNTRMIEQWIGMGRARSVKELKASLDKVVGLPWVNTVAADRFGKTLYADASAVPHMRPEKFRSDCFLAPRLVTFDGSRSACEWGTDPDTPPGIFSPVSAPWMFRTDYVGNSNDSYWLTNPRALLTGPPPLGYSPLYGQVAVEQTLRTRIGFKQLEEMLARKQRLSLNDLQELMFANRIYAAELILPEFLPLCFAASVPALTDACNVLAAWDKRANLDSRGAVLFREFWYKAREIPDLWALPFDPRDPVNTPRGLNRAVAPRMLAALGSAVSMLQGLKIAIDGRLGDCQGEIRHGVWVPLHGGIGDIDGSYNSIRTFKAPDERVGSPGTELEFAL